MNIRICTTANVEKRSLITNAQTHYSSKTFLDIFLGRSFYIRWLQDHWNWSARRQHAAFDTKGILLAA